MALNLTWLPVIWRRLLVPLLGTGVAFVATIALQPVVQRNLLVVFLASISLSAWAGGLPAGLWATLLTAIAAGILLFHPALSLHENDRGDLAALGVVALLGVFVSLLAQRLHASIAREREALGVAELLRAESEMARQEAVKANQAKVRFLTTMSHELRTPLNAIIGYVDLLSLSVHGPVTGEQQRALRAVDRSSQHLLSQINNILDFAKLDAGEVYYELEDVRIGDALRDIEVMVKPQLEAKYVRYSPCSIPAEWTVRADRQKVQQILLNLLSNAAKFTPDRGEVAIGCERLDDTVRIKVQNSGPGIPAEKLEAIFEPFVQLETVATSRALGTGLGLPISRELARGMGGDVRVESNIGGGSEFVLTLPRGADGSRSD